MPELTHWKNQQLNQMKRDIDQMFGELFRQFGGPGLAGREELPIPEIIETDEELTAVFDLPGLDPECLEVVADENSLRLQGSCEEERMVAGEPLRGRQTFSSRLHLPCRIMPEKATATIRGRSLVITMPKCRPGGFHTIPVQRT